MSRFAVAAALAASAFVLLPGSAAAQATVAQSSLSEYRYELIDLDANDGVAPSITFNTTFRGVLAAAVADASELLYFDGDGGLEGDVSFGAAAGSAAVQGWLTDGEIGTRGSIGNAGEYSGAAGWYADYTLSANTRLVFTGHAVGSVERGALVTDQYSSAGVAVLFAPVDDDGFSAQPYFARTATDSGVPGWGNFDEWFTLDIVNDGSTALSSQMVIQISANAEVASPVPEPATWLMLGAGLALTAGIARRRRTAGAN
ncbi:PEP-CTERM sorting domain-containing protein [Pseudoduganella umbonata]|uniref:PEP-CTERM sorting domain-containing protein n=1 Tax=Pseudoduganella umbonata TaxID=864828 RepID=A0A4V1EDJ3_9BURK|nr:PEP-CTERM sorting domain-containing protein [Pseudoduganella umbonata]MBB3224347.1 hypothetical protein [Pseudoduganella umbonata]QCP11281.1 PEP-CTERM sorting domain-containing protein [Pseudoduganella umbonata]